MVVGVGLFFVRRDETEKITLNVGFEAVFGLKVNLMSIIDITHHYKFQTDEKNLKSRKKVFGQFSVFGRFSVKKKQYPLSKY